jgi:hypothetical protein
VSRLVGGFNRRQGQPRTAAAALAVRPSAPGAHRCHAPLPPPTLSPGRALDRLLAAYVRPDGAPAGVPPELRDVTPGVQGVLQALAQVQAEAYTYAR